MTLIEREFLTSRIVYKTPSSKSGYVKDLTYSTELSCRGKITFKKQDIIKVSGGEDIATDTVFSTNLTLPVNTLLKIKNTNDWYRIISMYKKENSLSRINFYMIKKYGG